MRDTFMENHRKVEKSKRSGSGTDDVYKPKWPHFGSLQFMLKSAAQAESNSNIDLFCDTSKDSAETPTSSGASTSAASCTTLNLYFDENTQVSIITDLHLKFLS